MRMPGFTAEASAYDSHRHYHSAKKRSHLRERNGVAAQLNIGGGGVAVGGGNNEDSDTVCYQVCGWETCGSALPGHPVPKCYKCHPECLVTLGG
jgi:hypothetical protein